jgi:pyridoxal phosphate enzyme (YggS family)
MDSIHSVDKNIEGLRRRIARACERSDRDPVAVKIIAVTKNFSQRAIRDAISCGLTDFAENRVQEAAAKMEQLADCRSAFKLHFIGHLQSNKVRDALEIADVIHSVDTLSLACVINEKAARKVPVLIQVNLAGEESKFGFAGDNLDSAVRSICQLPNLEVWGLMAIAPQAADAQELRPLFARLKILNQAYNLRELSMGMSDDFEVAIEEGSTMVRIGRAIFGERS